MSGRIILVGDDIDTDQLAPGAYMKGGIEALAAHCLEGVRPGFAQEVTPGDVLVAGRNFGVGSSREQAAEALKHLGLAGVVALSFAGIFYRNAINLGLPVLTAPDLSAVTDGAAIEASQFSTIGWKARLSGSNLCGSSHSPGSSTTRLTTGVRSSGL